MTNFTQGTGTSSDPFEISTGAQCAEFFNRMAESIYAKLVANIDLKNIPHDTGYFQAATLFGYGFSISNYGHTIRVAEQGSLWPGGTGWNGIPPGIIKDVAFLNVHIGGVSYLTRVSSNPALKDCYVSFAPRQKFKLITTQGDTADADDQSCIDRCVFVSAVNAHISDDSKNRFYKSTSYLVDLVGSDSIAAGGTNVNLANINNVSFANLTGSYWVIKACAIPRIANAGVYLFSGKTYVDAIPASRDVHLLPPDSPSLMAAEYLAVKTVSDSSGVFNIHLDNDMPYTIVVQDHPGYELVLNRNYVVNELVMPTTANGYRYRCTFAGNSGGVMPPEVWPISGTVSIGLAQFIPEKINSSECYGPVRPKKVSSVTPSCLVLNRLYYQGEIVLPVNPVGYQWKCTATGKTGPVYPPEPWSTSAVMQVGSAQFTPEKI